MTRLILLRHGETDWNLQARWQGSADVPLNATGLAQAHLVAEKLALEHLAAIYSSDLTRARVTADIVARPHALEVLVDARLREINMGRWENQLQQEIPGLYPVEWAAWQGDNLHAPPLGGESVIDLARRIIPAIRDISSRYTAAEQILIVGHGLSLAVFLTHVNHQPLATVYERILPNATPLFLDWIPDLAGSADGF